MFKENSMKKSLLITACLSLALWASEPNCIVRVENIKSESGIISIGVYNTKESFPKQDARIEGKFVSVEEAKAGVSFTLEPGTYAIGIYHDLNSNNELDKGAFGMPSEPYAFSNNKYASMGRPDYEKAQFTVESGTVHTQTMKLR